MVCFLAYTWNIIVRYLIYLHLCSHRDEAFITYIPQELVQFIMESAHSESSYILHPIMPC